jgi:hypothetical protein
VAISGFVPTMHESRDCFAALAMTVSGYAGCVFPGSQGPPHMLKGSYGSVGTSESSPVIHRGVKNGAPVKVVQSQGDS